MHIAYNYDLTLSILSKAQFNHENIKIKSKEFKESIILSLKP